MSSWSLGDDKCMVHVWACLRVRACVCLCAYVMVNMLLCHTVALGCGAWNVGMWEVVTTGLRDLATAVDEP